MIKVIASDMDGTLLCDDHRIAPDTIAAVKEACAAGIRFMVATGRGYEGAMAELDGTGIVCDYILGSGAEVRDPQRKIVKECGIGMELCREICEEVKEFPISIVFLTNEGDYRIGTEKEVEESIIAEMQLFHVNMTREEVVKTSEYRRLFYIARSAPRGAAGRRSGWRPPARGTRRDAQRQPPRRRAARRAPLRRWPRPRSRRHPEDA